MYEEKPLIWVYPNYLLLIGFMLILLCFPGVQCSNSSLLSKCLLTILFLCLIALPPVSGAMLNGAKWRISFRFLTLIPMKMDILL